MQQANSSGSVDTMQKAIELHPQVRHARRRASASRLPFLPVDAGDALRKRIAATARSIDALFVLERLRARKTPEELEMLRDRLRARDRLDAWR